MKKLLYFLLLLPFAAHGQTIDTTFNQMPTCKITPILQDRLDIENSSRVGINTAAIDFGSNTVMVNYIFFGNSGNVISNSGGYFTVKFSSFRMLLTALKTGNSFLFAQIGTYLKLTYQ